MRKPCRTSDRRSISGVSDTNGGLLEPTRPGMSGTLRLADGARKRLVPRQTYPRNSAMTRFTVHTTQSAPAASRPLLEGIERTFGFVPNLFSVFAESPAALGGG